MSKAIMVQGTMSNAGKSLVCAGLCAAFRQEGLRVAPFKSQNMALNSFVTRDGLEMGRAQVVQAEACGIEPDVRMNPVLLKPVSDVGSQVIVNGEVRGNYDAGAYFAMKKQLVPDILRAYHSLASEYDVIVIEGAGSPAEINLKTDDIVNMGMARMAKAPVLLVGDIDRGGVFAQLYGTVALLDDDEKAYVKATVINKFRGDVKLLEPGLTMLEELTNKPVAGVLPYLNVDIDDEDSLSERLTRGSGGAAVDIAVVRLPHLSNFTDFAALEATHGVGLRYVRRLADLGTPDLIVLPGTKNTIGDLLWLRQSGLEAAIKKLYANETPILGICGGYQMLGRRIVDATGAEGGGAADGLGLLPVHTTFAAEQRRTRVTAAALNVGGVLSRLSGATLEGYEIHMGESVPEDKAQPLLLLEDGREDGCQSGNAYGTYLHGFFDSTQARESILAALCEKKGVSIERPAFDFQQYRRSQYDLLGEQIALHLNMRLIHRILEEGI
jgi:adenosylcobyric acid synthase